MNRNNERRQIMNRNNEPRSCFVPGARFADIQNGCAYFSPEKVEWEMVGKFKVVKDRKMSYIQREHFALTCEQLIVLRKVRQIIKIACPNKICIQNLNLQQNNAKTKSASKSKISKK
jgi:hypothetical protein